MNIDRRTFLVVTGACAAAPALAGLANLGGPESRRVAATTEAARPRMPAAGAVGRDGFALRIQGWDAAPVSADDGSPPSAIDAGWLAINGRWRVAWR